MYIHPKPRAASIPQQVYLLLANPDSYTDVHPDSAVAGTCFPRTHSQHIPCVKFPIQLLALQSHCSSLIQEAEFAEAGCSNWAPADVHPVHFILAIFFFPHLLLPKKK